MTVSSDRRLRGHEKPTRRILAVWALLSVIFLAVGMPRLLQGQFPDPDDALRLVQVRDLLAGQNWFDLAQHRIDPGANGLGGTQMHWSRLVDIPLLLLIGLLTPLLGAGNAETVALIAVPLLTLGAILLVIGRLAWRLFDKEVAGLACICAGLLAPVVFQLQPMRIDHHGWQIFAVALALWGISLRDRLKGGALAGFAMALGMSISIELLPLAGAFGAVLGLRWLRDRNERWWLVGYMQALALALTGFFLLSHGWSNLGQYCDAISPAHLGFFIVTAIGTGIFAAAPKVPTMALLGLFALAGAAGLSFFALSAPQCVASPFATLDPLVRDYWYLNISEGRPLWEQDLSVAIPTLLQLLVGLWVTVVLVARSRNWLRMFWTDYVLLLGAAILLSLVVWRSAAFAGIIAAIPLGWLASRILWRLRHADRPLQKLATAVAMILLLLPAAPITLGKRLLPSTDGQVLATVSESQCVIREQAGKLAALPTGTIYAPLDIGPTILLKSPHSVVATGHHRANEAMRDVIAGFTASPEEARRLIDRHRADYIVMCSDLGEPRLYAEANEDGLAARLIDGRVPDWLEPVGLDGPEQFRVWRVKRD